MSLVFSCTCFLFFFLSLFCFFFFSLFTHLFSEGLEAFILFFYLTEAGRSSVFLLLGTWAGDRWVRSETGGTDKGSGIHRDVAKEGNS